MLALVEGCGGRSSRVVYIFVLVTSGEIVFLMM